MKMVVKRKTKKICPCCMTEHEVQTVQVKESASFKGRTVRYNAVYEYCDLADELYANEKQLQENDIRLKNAYRKAEGLLTSDEIASIRKKYDISQNDLSILLGWGVKTITRYESHQVQDRAHDSILKKLDSDPEWFISLLYDAKDSFNDKAFQRYLAYASELYAADEDLYLRKSIEAQYAKYQENNILNGNTKLSLDKVVEVIRYFSAGSKVKNLYKVKLMKLMWYADALAYKKLGHAITGLVYQALPMGAVPIGHYSIIDLKGVPCEEVEIGKDYGYHFSLKEDVECKTLTQEEIEILDEIIAKFGKKSTEEIVAYMHKEKAYIETEKRGIISFEYSERLSL